MKEIEWDQGQYSCFNGKINGVRVCSIEYSMTRQDPKPYILRSSAFGLTFKKHFKDLEEAKAFAPRAVQALVSRVL